MRRCGHHSFLILQQDLEVRLANGSRQGLEFTVHEISVVKCVWVRGRFGQHRFSILQRDLQVRF